MNQDVQGFMDDMAQLGLNPRVEAGLVICRIMPVEGARAGVAVETGVSTDELTPWPQVPPHWVHLPADIAFSRTNARVSPKHGWLKHSRQLNGWGNEPPGRCWAGHVRSVIGEATA